MFTSAAILQEVANSFKRKHGFYCIDVGVSSLDIHHMTLKGPPSSKTHCGRLFMF